MGREGGREQKHWLMKKGSVEKEELGAVVAGRRGECNPPWSI